MQSAEALYSSSSRQARRWILAFELIAILSVCTGILVTDVKRIRTHATGDFEHFYYAADAMRCGQDPYAAWTRGYIYPPLIAFVFQPLSYLGRDRAAALMLAVNVAITLLTVALAADEFLRRFRVSRDLPVIAGIMLIGLLLNIDKVKGEWQMWQTDVFMLLLFVMALRWLDRLPVAAGIALGIAINIKYLPLLFLPYLLLRRRWKSAAGLVVGTILFALLPALRTGWSQNVHNWSTAANGLLQMAGAGGKPTEAAEVHDLRDSLSCSITSAFARAAWNAQYGFALATCTALIAMLLAWWMYQQKRVAFFFRSPDRSDQDLALTGVEWVMLVAAVLAFGPQTNTRHLFDALVLTTAAGVLLIFHKSATRPWPLLVGITVLFLGFVLPPGNRTVKGEHNPTVIWLRAGGPCWCLLVAAFTLLQAGLAEATLPSKSIERPEQ